MANICKITFISQLLYGLVSDSGSVAIDGTKCTLAPCAVNNGGIAGLRGKKGGVM